MPRAMIKDTAAERQLTSWDIVADKKLPKELRFEAFASALKEDGKKTGQWWTGTLLRHSEYTVRSCILSNQKLQGVYIDVRYVADEALLTLFEKAFAIEQNPRTYFRMIVRNKLYEYRRQAGAVMYAEPLSEPSQVPDSSKREEGDGRQFVERDVNQESLSRVFKAILKDSDCKIMELRYLKGMTCVEIAMKLGIQHSAARKRLSRAKDRLLRDKKSACEMLTTRPRGVSV